MVTDTDISSGGIRDPYRSLLILSGGILLALALLAGQAGYREDLPPAPQHSAKTSSAGGIQTSR